MYTEKQQEILNFIIEYISETPSHIIREEIQDINRLNIPGPSISKYFASFQKQGESFPNTIKIKESEILEIQSFPYYSKPNLLNTYLGTFNGFEYKSHSSNVIYHSGQFSVEASDEALLNALSFIANGDLFYKREEKQRINIL